VYWKIYAYSFASRIHYPSTSFVNLPLLIRGIKMGEKSQLNHLIFPASAVWLHLKYYGFIPTYLVAIFKGMLGQF
jgi:hypothetical protein